MSSRQQAPKECSCTGLEAEVDELWSFVGKKANRQWVWIAMNAVTHQIIAFHVGDRSRQSAEALWGKIPSAVYQEQATFYTDCYEVYKGSGLTL